VDPIGSALPIIGAYAMGALPWGVVLGRVSTGTDLRHHGSHSTGATNAYRVLGKRAAIAVLVLDFLKGLVPVVLARWLNANWWVVGAVAVAAVAGHCWSPYIGFSGGKGVATGGGALFGMMPWLVVVVLPLVIIVLVTRFVSLGSLISAVAAALLAVAASVFGFETPAAAVAASLIAAIVVFRHQDNIRRLRSGTENRFGQQSTSA
jgi:glycerol-3-phosphate acyltransferase PlsY